MKIYWLFLQNRLFDTERCISHLLQQHERLGSYRERLIALGQEVSEDEGEDDDDDGEDDEDDED